MGNNHLYRNRKRGIMFHNLGLLHVTYMGRVFKMSTAAGGIQVYNGVIKLLPLTFNIYLLYMVT